MKLIIKILCITAIVGALAVGLLAAHNYKRRIENSLFILRDENLAIRQFLTKYMPDEVEEHDAIVKANNTPAK